MYPPRNGIILLETENSPIASPLREFLRTVKYLLAGVIGGLFLLIVLPLLYMYSRFFSPQQKRVMVGTHPIVSNIHYKQLLAKALDEYEVEIFIFKDWLGEPSYFDIQATDILPRWLVGKDAYWLAPYVALPWALWRYRGFYWHLDGALLERTVLWKLEPLILALFGKKIVMQAYGTDQWALLQSSYDLNFKFGLARFKKNYFAMDFKRIERNYMWAKYVHIMAGDIRYLPRAAAFSLAHFYIDFENLPYVCNENMEKIIITHYANHPERKGSSAIEAVCQELISEGYGIEYRSVQGVSREKALALLDESHIFIEHLFNGVFGTAALEAMAKGNVVMTNLDQRLIDFCLVQEYAFYKPFFEEMPLININIHTLKEALVGLIEDKSALKKRIKASRKFVELSSKRVVDGFKHQNMFKQIFENSK